MKHELNKPLTFEGKEYKDINVPLESLTGDDIVVAEREFVATGNAAGVAETSKAFQAYVAARAAKVPVELILSLGAKDFTAITLQVQNFLLMQD
ncbi:MULTISPECIES: phage tail assembly protein [Aminobacterium]|jgi:hypothetical protein|uniref:Phage tail assembly protein n=1 Tax=Aminobacterium colombiense (strain DSM 12261 / ALA-1) TaxID=572547 RepID=D5EFA4_AMICL|nr:MULTISPECIES: phage tail assembly protein [Aminobacterium]ADE57236.1 conserved hypothetical protein [Aminobacterium colombiense DSM 12261]